MMKIRPRIVTAAALGVLVLVLVLQNTEVVAVRFFFWDFTMSRVILVLMTTLIGFIGGYLVAVAMASRDRSKP